MPKMMATSKFKGRRYDGKVVSTGDVLTVKNKDVRLLSALGWVTSYDVPTTVQALVEVPKSTPHVVESHVEPKPIDPLRFVNTKEEEVMEKQEETTETTEYSRMLRDRAMSLGIRVDGRWSDARIQREIDDHNRHTYQRTDLRSSE